jgi:predicted anti-sigma-YlaC factor YlaD
MRHQPTPRREGPPQVGLLLAGLLALAVLGSGCSLRRLALNQLGNALAQSGTTFASDDDPDLIRDAAPFSLKLMESVLAETPRHGGLLAALTSGFAQYAYAFVQQEAESREATDLAAADQLRARARRLYLRARDYGLRGLEARHGGIRAALDAKPKDAVGRATRADVPLLYWTAAAWGAAISISKDRPDLVAGQPQVEALIDRAVQLDADFGEGALHTFLISYEPARPGVQGDRLARARVHFDRAVALSQGEQAAPFVAWAEVSSIQTQKRAEFEDLLQRALAVDPNARPEWRLVNLVMQRRARWLLDRREELFLPTE